jgi:predicted RNA-binding Zn ribbon-like protein
VPPSSVQTIRLVAGRACLDLVNTVSWRGDPARWEDHLTGAADCLTWAVRAGVLATGERDVLAATLADDVAAGDRVLRRLVELRELVAADVTGTDPPRVERLEPLLKDAVRHGVLRPTAPDDDGFAWHVDGLDEHTVDRRLALDVLDLLAGPRRLGRCADDACGWVFLDTSRGGRRQWCSSADCGNRHRVRRHQRSRAERGQAGR